MTSTNPSTNPWTRRLRRLSYFFGVAGTFYLISSYTLDRMREARIRAVKERKDRDLLKSHFSALLSTLSFTLYALLPTLSPQIEEAYPIEQISQALQGLSNPASSQISTASASASASDTHHDEAEAEGRVLETSIPDIPSESGGGEVGRGRGAEGAGEGVGRERSVSAGQGSVSESWASEFRGNGRDEEIYSLGQTETDDGLGSAISQPISLPPTDLSTSSGSPPSDFTSSSHLLPLSPSPPRYPAFEEPSSGLSGKSKKELWRDLKVQSISRAITTAYLLPLLYILTTSQLSTLARERYLSDVKSSLPPIPPLSSQPTLANPTDEDVLDHPPSLLSEAISLLPNPLSILPRSIISRLPFSSAPKALTAEESYQASLLVQERKEAEELERAEAERMYLTYSWWILHEGWRVIAGRVDRAVEDAIGPLGLKREVSVEEWEGLIRDIGRGVEYDEDEGLPFDFTPHLLPPSPLPLPTSSSPCPLPLSPNSARLQYLLFQTRTHLASTDAADLIASGVETMLSNLLQSLTDELYSSPPPSLVTSGYLSVEGGDNRIERGKNENDKKQSKRLAECLPVFSNWSKGVWGGVPDNGIEGLLSLSGFEGFAGLIFADWA